jgi:hypothetical protein
VIEIDQQQLVVEVAREVVGDVAPEELALLGPMSAAYFTDPDRALSGRTLDDEPLGFGVPVDGQLLTPIVLAVLTQVLAFLVTEVRKSVQAEAPDLIHEHVKRLFKKLRPADAEAEAAAASGGKPATPPPLSSQQLARVREIALARARQLGLTGSKAELLADSVVGGLVVAS